MSEPETAWLFVALSFVGCVPSAAAGGWQVARVRVNGVAIELREGEFRVAGPALAAALSTRWQGTGPTTPSVVSLGARLVVGRQRGRFHETVTLRRTGPDRTQVLVAVTDLGARPSRASRLPLDLPAGHQVLQVVEHGEGRGAVSAFTLVSDRHPQVALRQWQRTLADAGWSPRVSAPGGGALRRWVLWATRGREHLDAVCVEDHDGARIVLQVSGDAH